MSLGGVVPSSARPLPHGGYAWCGWDGGAPTSSSILRAGLAAHLEGGLGGHAPSHPPSLPLAIAAPLREPQALATPPLPLSVVHYVMAPSICCAAALFLHGITDAALAGAAVGREGGEGWGGETGARISPRGASVRVGAGVGGARDTSGCVGAACFEWVRGAPLSSTPAEEPAAAGETLVRVGRACRGGCRGNVRGPPPPFRRRAGPFLFQTPPAPSAPTPHPPDSTVVRPLFDNARHETRAQRGPDRGGPLPQRRVKLE